MKQKEKEKRERRKKENGKRKRKLIKIAIGILHISHILSSIKCCLYVYKLFHIPNTLLSWQLVHWTLT